MGAFPIAKWEHSDWGISGCHHPFPYMSTSKRAKFFFLVKAENSNKKLGICLNMKKRGIGGGWQKLPTLKYIPEKWIALERFLVLPIFKGFKMLKVWKSEFLQAFLIRLNTRFCISRVFHGLPCFWPCWQCKIMKVQGLWENLFFL